MVGLILVPVGPVRRGPPQQPGQHKRRSRSGDGPVVPVVPIFSSQVGRESWRGYTATGRERRYFITNSINNWDNWDNRANATTGAGKICPSSENLSRFNWDRGFLPPWPSGERVFGVWGLHSPKSYPAHVREGMADPALPGGIGLPGPAPSSFTMAPGKPSINNQPIDAADIGLVDLRVPGPPLASGPVGHPILTKEVHRAKSS